MEDDRLIPLSYIAQYCFCKRRVGLLMLEQQWAESVDTAKGRLEHKNVHASSIAKAGAVQLISNLTLVSRSMQLFGKSDAIEAMPAEKGMHFPFLDDSQYMLYPIEYKHGKLRNEPEYAMQLCAQAMCLEEMYGCRIERGALFYISSHRRKEVEFGQKLRRNTAETAAALSVMLQTAKVPGAERSSKCVRCSMREICMPDTEHSVQSYMKRINREIEKGAAE